LYPGDTHILGTAPALCQRGSRERLFAAGPVARVAPSLLASAPIAATSGREMAR
jgi:hypothetical protein